MKPAEEPAPERTIRLALLDDHPIVLEGLVAMFKRLPGYHVVFTAGGALEFVSGLRDHPVVDIALVDLKMAGPDGFHALECLRTERPEIRCVSFSLSDAPEHVRRAVALGARGHVLKESRLSVWHTTITQVLEHGFCYTDLISKSLAAPPAIKPAAGVLDWHTIPPRERVFALLLLEPGDLLYTVIAERMGVGLSTVDGYFRWFSKHYGTHSRAELVALLLRSSPRELTAPEGFPRSAG